MDEAIRILLIDDHSLFREAIARLLSSQSDFQIAGECSTVEDSIRILKSAPVDIVLLDINLGLQQGGAFLKLARDAGFTGKILVVTAGVSKLEAARLLKRGCSRIFLKQDRPELLVGAIREVVAETAKLDPVAVKTELQRIESSAPPLPSPLTSREREVLCGVFGGLATRKLHSISAFPSLW